MIHLSFILARLRVLEMTNRTVNRKNPIKSERNRQSDSSSMGNPAQGNRSFGNCIQFQFGNSIETSFFFGFTTTTLNTDLKVVSPYLGSSFYPTAPPPTRSPKSGKLFSFLFSLSIHSIRLGLTS